jgi:hypothetical protein
MLCMSFDRHSFGMVQSCLWLIGLRRWESDALRRKKRGREENQEPGKNVLTTCSSMLYSTIKNEGNNAQTNLSWHYENDDETCISRINHQRHNHTRINPK